MATFLRDERLVNLTLTEDRIRQLDAIIRSRAQIMPEALQETGKQASPSFFVFDVIRFDNKGYRVFSVDELLSYYHQADYVERVIFIAESRESLHSNRNIGSYIDLRLDAGDQNACLFTVSSEDGNWVDATFVSVKEVVEKCNNRNRWARGALSHIAIQIVGVLLGFMFSLWAAVRMSPLVAVDNSFFILFLFTLLVFSNLWTFLSQGLLRFVDRTFPNMRFYRPDRDKLHWLSQAVVGGIVAAIAIYLLGMIFTYLGQVLGQIVNASA